MASPNSFSIIILMNFVHVAFGGKPFVPSINSIALFQGSSIYAFEYIETQNMRYRLEVDGDNCSFHIRDMSVDEKDISAIKWRSTDYNYARVPTYTDQEYCQLTLQQGGNMVLSGDPNLPNIWQSNSGEPSLENSLCRLEVAVVDLPFLNKPPCPYLAIRCSWRFGIDMTVWRT